MQPAFQVCMWMEGAACHEQSVKGETKSQRKDANGANKIEQLLLSHFLC